MSQKKEEIIDVGIELFADKGYSNVGIAEVLKMAKVPKGSFYYYFKSKEDFGIQVLSKYSNGNLSNLKSRLEDPSLSPKSRIIAFYKSYIPMLSAHGFERGCLLGESCTENQISDEFTQFITNETTKWQETLEICIKEAQSQGEINPAKNSKMLAAFIYNSWEGALLRMKTIKSEEPLKHFIQGIELILT